jgi:putative SOS response-associated peptidase YedK
MRHGAKGNRLATSTIATCPPNELMEKIHDQMPVILPEGASRLVMAGVDLRTVQGNCSATRNLL